MNSEPDSKNAEGIERAALENMIALREARDASRPGSKEYKELDDAFKKTEANYYKVRR